SERMCVNHGVGGAFRFNRRHVAGHALASGAAFLMVRVFLECRRSRPAGRKRSMTFQAELVSGLPQLRVVVCTVYIVAIEARDPAAVHYALHEIVPLHPVLVRGTVWVVEEISRLAESVPLQFPEILQPEPRLIAHGPIVVFAVYRVRQGLSLRMALNAGIARRHVVHVRRIDDVVPRRFRRMLAAWTVAALTTHVPD